MTKKKNRVRSQYRHLQGANFGNPYRTADTVKKIVDDYTNNIAAYGKTDSPIIKETQARLTDLKHALANEEAALFAKFPALKNISNYGELNNKLQSWLSATTRESFVNKDKILRILSLLMTDISTEDIINDLNIIFEDKAVQQTLENYAVSNLVDALNAIGVNAERTKHSFKALPDKGVLAALIIDKKDDRYIVKQKTEGDAKDLAPTMAYKLAELINAQKVANTKTYDLSRRRYEEVLTDLINIVCEGIGSPQRSYIEFELRERGNNYAHWANYNVIKGWLGEVYWNACLNYLFGAKVTWPTGNLKNLQGQSVSVDILIRTISSDAGIGFQVKSWSLANLGEDEEKHSTDSTDKLFGDFIFNRAQLPMGEGQIGTIIARMFGAAAYNFPNEEFQINTNSFDHKALFSEYQNFYNANLQWGAEPPVARDAVPRAQELETAFYSALDKIIAIDRNDIIKGASNQAPLKNTFWLINDMLIPSSVIIDEMIEQLGAVDRQANYITFSLLSTAFTRSSQGKSKWPETTKVNFSDLAMANRWKISYNVTFYTKRLYDAVQKRVRPQKT